MVGSSITDQQWACLQQYPQSRESQGPQPPSFSFAEYHRALEELGWGSLTLPYLLWTGTTSSPVALALSDLPWSLEWVLHLLPLPPGLVWASASFSLLLWESWCAELIGQLSQK